MSGAAAFPAASCAHTSVDAVQCSCCATSVCPVCFIAGFNIDLPLPLPDDPPALPAIAPFCSCKRCRKPNCTVCGRWCFECGSFFCEQCNAKEAAYAICSQCANAYCIGNSNGCRSGGLCGTCATCFCNECVLVKMCSKCSIWQCENCFVMPWCVGIGCERCTVKPAPPTSSRSAVYATRASAATAQRSKTAYRARIARRGSSASSVAVRTFARNKF